MPRDLFGDVTRPSVSLGNRKWYTVPVSLLSHSAIVCAFVVIPLMATNALPNPWQKIEAPFMPIVPTPPAPPRLRPVPPEAIVNHNAAPVVAPDSITRERPVDFDTSFQQTQDGIVGGAENIEHVIAAPPRPVAAAPPPPVRVGGAIRAPQKVNDALPIYPPLAQSARVQGIVIIEATIGADGQVVNARVLRSVPLLDQAAVDAVRQWRYTPTLLNGVPVPVIMTVTVTFTLR
jgi:periplasmic protein TonB